MITWLSAVPFRESLLWMNGLIFRRLISSPLFGLNHHRPFIHDLAPAVFFASNLPTQERLPRSYLQKSPVPWAVSNHERSGWSRPKNRRKKMKTKNTPSHTVFQVIEREKSASIWTRVGAAWIHQDGK